MSFYFNIVHVKTLFSGGETVLVFLIILKLMNVNGDLGSVSVFRSIRSMS